MQCLDMMQTGSSHMILVVQGKEGQGYAESIAVDVNGGDEADQPSKSSSSPNGCPLEDSEVIGIITLEDIVEGLSCCCLPVMCVFCSPGDTRSEESYAVWPSQS